MPRINTNVAALNAQRNTTATENSLRTSLERLSSGMRINRAADDAAGLSISEKLRGQVRGLNQAVANAQDTINLIGTAEGAMNESTAILQRMRELSVQSANDTNTALDRQAIQDEVIALKSELSRIAETTQYNGKSLLDGSFNGTFQIGANAGQTVSKSIDSMTSNSIGRSSFESISGKSCSGATVTAAYDGTSNARSLTSTGFATTATSGTASVTVAGSLGSQAVTFAYDSQASTVAAAVNAASGNTGVAATAKTEVTGASTVKAGVAKFQIITDTGYATINANVVANDSDGSLVNAINAQSTKTGVTASIANGKITLANTTGETITLRDLNSGGTATNTSTTDTDGRYVTGLALTENVDYHYAGKVEFESAKSFSVTESVAASLSGLVNGGASATATIAKNTVADVDLTSVAGAKTAIKIIDKALEGVSKTRSGLGALQNRLQSTINNLSVASENLSNADSRIRDVDFATEIVAMTRSQILQQSGTSILAQANQLPQSALSLLR